MNLFELSAKISADTKDYEKAVKNATKVSKSLKDIMERSATQSETNKNKIKVLAGEYSSAKAKVAVLTEAFNKAAKEEGVTAEKTQKLAKELQEAEKESSDLKGQLDELTKKSKNAGDGFSKLGSALGKGLKTAGKIGIAAVGAAAAGITALTTAAVNNYAEYEQLVGGIETLYEDLSWDVGQNAAKAFQTAGLSANEYMSTAMSFAASLNQSLTEMDGNIARSADLTDQAILDMADNANKMGSDMSTLQTAYAGFAKQNYTLLDNLKIGYGGTKEEMQRLIADAAKLSDTVDAQSMSFANIVEAIHIVQTEMGITGTTSLEAGRTISGSVGAMKSAWANLVTGLADGNADIGKLVDNLVTTIVGDGTESNLGVLGNILPAVEKALLGAGKLIKGAVPILVEMLPGLLEQILPVLLSAATDLVRSVVAVLPQIVQLVIDILPELLDFVVDALIDNAPMLIVAAVELVLALAAGLIDAIPRLIQAIPTIIKETVDGFKKSENIKKFMDVGKNIIDGIKSGIKNAWNNLISWFKGLFGNLIDIAKKILGIASPSKVFKKIGGFTAEGFGAGFEDEFAHVKDDMEDALNFDDASVGINASIRNVGAGAAGGAFGGTSIGNININIDGAKYSDEQSLASAIALEIQNMTDRRAAVYA